MTDLSSPKPATEPASTTPDEPTIERLANAFNRCFETFHADADAFRDDVFCDMYPPFWRFQIQGRDDFARQLGAVAHGPSSVRTLRTVPTATGFVLEHEEREVGGQGEVARRLWLCEVRDGRIAAVVGYCNGGWDHDLRTRHASEAPMLRPWETDR